jgi:hypothetical protein
MTQTETNGDAPTELETSSPRKFYVNFESYPGKNRSRDIFLRDRMCAESRGGVGVTPPPDRGKAEPEEGTGGRVRFNTRRGKVGAGAVGDALATIQDCCSKKPEYRDPHLPAKEILFRIILAEGNSPTTGEDLRAAMATWTGYEYGGGLTTEGVEQLLGGDEYYGFEVAAD